MDRWTIDHPSHNDNFSTFEDLLHVLTEYEYMEQDVVVRAILKHLRADSEYPLGRLLDFLPCDYHSEFTQQTLAQVLTWACLIDDLEVLNMVFSHLKDGSFYEADVIDEFVEFFPAVALGTPTAEMS